MHSVPAGAGAQEWLEMIARDNPVCGNGGATQFTSKVQVTVQVIDLETGQAVQDKNHLRQILGL